jgi:hypothetical protein
VIGIVFSIVRVTVQMNLLSASAEWCTTMIDHAATDLWIVPQGWSSRIVTAFRAASGFMLAISR